MNEEDRDLQLQAIFNNSRPELISDDFTEAVLRRTRRHQKLLLLPWLLATIAVLLGIWLFSVPLPEIAVQISQILTASLFDLGDGWFAWALLPVNNIGSVLMVIYKLIRLVARKNANPLLV